MVICWNMSRPINISTTNILEMVFEEKFPFHFTYSYVGSIPIELMPKMSAGIWISSAMLYNANFVIGNTLFALSMLPNNNQIMCEKLQKSFVNNKTCYPCSTFKTETASNFEKLSDSEEVEREQQLRCKNLRSTACHGNYTKMV